MKNPRSKAPHLFLITALFLALGFALGGGGLVVAAELETEVTGKMQDFPIVKLQSLDKVTARTMTFEARVGSTVKFGQIYIKVQACRKASPLELPESAAFLQIWQITLEEKAEWIFSGWMFASSPGLSSMDHPIYDVWVIDCLESKNNAKAGIEKEELGEGESKNETLLEPKEKLE